MKIRKIIFSALVLFGFTSFSGIANAECGKLVIAEQNWASAELMANVDKIILEKGYGCEVELIPGATMPTFTSMEEKGEPDMKPDSWANAVYTPLKKAVSEKRLIIGNKAPITGLGEGWWITPGTVEKIPEIKGMTYASLGLTPPPGDDGIIGNEDDPEGANMVLNSEHRDLVVDALINPDND